MSARAQDFPSFKIRDDRTINYNADVLYRECMPPKSCDIATATDSAEVSLLKFRRLANTWRKETRHMSSVDDICTHPAYKEIIKMRTVAVPYILRELETRPAYWFWALTAIIHEDPLPSPFQGTFKEAVQLWLDWARAAGHSW